ncbi:hypothetical protein [Acidovorax sp. BL-A-41-H1]|uniref:hypothetical protein n=1 Tax=Acidovorax sp. BL-A-41-H1 TaxID=3421102 RepID=UPI003F7ADE31
MWFINGTRQVIELKWGAQEKRARRMATRPEPTIIGNCESWSFIVGKKGESGSQSRTISAKLPHCNSDFMHRLYTVCKLATLDNLWVSTEIAEDRGTNPVW